MTYAICSETHINYFPKQIFSFSSVRASAFAMGCSYQEDHRDIEEKKLVFTLSRRKVNLFEQSKYIVHMSNQLLEQKY